MSPIKSDGTVLQTAELAYLQVPLEEIVPHPDISRLRAKDESMLKSISQPQTSPYGLILLQAPTRTPLLDFALSGESNQAWATHVLFSGW